MWTNYFIVKEFSFFISFFFYNKKSPSNKSLGAMQMDSPTQFCQIFVSSSSRGSNKLEFFLTASSDTNIVVNTKADKTLLKR